LHKTSDQHRPLSIVVEDVQKNFRLRHTHSFKETAMAALHRKQLTSEFHALDGVSFEIEEGESVALLGFNGSGKSTTLKMISGVLRPDQGHVYTRGRIAGLIEVGAGFHPDLSGRENIYLNAAILGMSKKETEKRFDEIVAFSEIGQFIDNEVKHYSSGMFLRLAFSVAIHTEVDILLIDEILSVGDEPFQKKCLARIRELHARGKTLVVVSHDLGMVSRLCDRGIVLKDGKVVFDGPSTAAVRELRKLSRSPFVDVPREHEFFENVVRVADAQILPTSSDESGARVFDPGRPVTVGEMARTFHLLSSPVSKSPASDERTAMQWLDEHRTDARSEAVLLTEGVLTREAMASILFARRPASAPPEAPAPLFTDVDESSPHFDAISWLHATAITKGWTDDHGLLEYRPTEPVTRDAVVVLISRFVATTRQPRQTSDLA
jgi:ABC-2 type transport system ATP-binding protein